jgi:hypothetical protein
MNTTVNWWNKGIALKNPSVSDIQRTMDRCIVQRVFPHSPSILYAGNNILVRTASGEAVFGDTPVISISVIAITDYFKAETSIVPNDGKALTLFGARMEGSAEDWLQYLKSFSGLDLQLVNEPEQWSIIVGCSVTLQFRPLTLSDLSHPFPPHSRMTDATFNFRIRYQGMTLPLLSYNK